MTHPRNESEPKGIGPRHPAAGGTAENDNRDEGMDKTLADSFPASDPPSSIPNPEDEENAA